MRRFLVVTVSLFAVLEALFFVWAVREQSGYNERLSSLAVRLQDDLDEAMARAERAGSELALTRNQLAVNRERLNEAEQRARQLEVSLTMVSPDPLCPLPDPGKLLQAVTRLFTRTVGREPTEVEVRNLVRAQTEASRGACLAVLPAGQNERS